MGYYRIYKTTNLLNGKFYIGQTRQNNNRYYKGSGIILSNAIKKYGGENFIVETLEVVDSIDKLDEREKYWISKLKPEYNISPGGLTNDAVAGGKATLGLRRTKEQKKKMSLAQRNSKIHKEVMRSKEVREKISRGVSKVSKELWKSDEYREKQRLAHKRYYEENPKVKKEDLIKVLESNKSVTEIIYELGVSIPTYYKYKRQYGV
ncbi:GIY-YIG nuclease family protein [Candidatus Woesearchaeota archaeon]|jgi:group I intron endonuclease|nr:GIY-YIG nuclease family protein [Candidatus Woesearchaeota archaeon]MBT7556279.1 GIY-YIG nuclease family protein [Candidatus Woesearchaeota archaeon]